MLRHNHLPDHANLVDLYNDLGQRGKTVLQWADYGREALQFMGQTIPESDADVFRAMVANSTIGDAIDRLFGAKLLAGFEKEPDTSLFWTREESAENFLASELYTLATGARMEPLPAGGMATEAEYNLAKTTYKIGRFARRVEVDEREMIDEWGTINRGSMSAIMFAVEQLGAEARRLRPDLVYSLILENPAMQYDGTALFHTDHANLGTAAMATAGLSAAIAAIGNQTLADAEGDPIHTNQSARVLIVPPDLVEVTRRTVRNTILGDGNDIKVLQESRLGAAGLVDPNADIIRAGTTTNWMMAGTSHTRPAVVVLGLNGNLRPKISRYKLAPGRWGWGWRIALDIGVVVVDHRPLYWSSGTV